MKHVQYFLFILITVLVTACSEGGEIESYAPDRSSTIYVHADAASFPLDPLQITVRVKSGAFDRELNLEAMMSGLNESTCKIQWKSDHLAYITFLESDETSRKVEVISDSTQLRIRLMEENE